MTVPLRSWTCCCTWPWASLCRAVRLRSHSPFRTAGEGAWCWVDSIMHMNAYVSQCRCVFSMAKWEGRALDLRAQTRSG